MSTFFRIFTLISILGIAKGFLSIFSPQVEQKTDLKPLRTTLENPSIKWIGFPWQAASVIVNYDGGPIEAGQITVTSTPFISGLTGNDIKSTGTDLMIDWGDSTVETFPNAFDATGKPTFTHFNHTYTDLGIFDLTYTIKGASGTEAVAVYKLQQIDTTITDGFNWAGLHNVNFKLDLLEPNIGIANIFQVRSFESYGLAFLDLEIISPIVPQYFTQSGFYRIEAACNITMSTTTYPTTSYNTIYVDLPTACTDELEVTTVENNQTYICDSIRSGVLIPANYQIVFDACEVIRLTPGFHADNTVNFSARIGCSTNLMAAKVK